MSTSRWVKRDELPNVRNLRGRIGLGGVYPNDGYIAGVAKNIEKNFDLVQSAAGAPGAVTSLHEFTIPSGALKPGEFLDVGYGGFYTPNDNDKGLVVDFGTANVETTGLKDIDDLGWQFFIRYGIVNATTVRYALTLVAGMAESTSAPVFTGGFGTRIISRGGTLTPANMDSNSQLLRVRGQGTALGDVTKTVAIINITRF